MPALRDWLAAPSAVFLWLEYEAYARRVFANAGDDWYADAPRYAATLIQAHGVLPTGCINVDVITPFLQRADVTPRTSDGVLEALADAASATFVDAALDALSHRFAGQVDIFLKIPAPADLLDTAMIGSAIDFDMLDDIATAITGHCRRWSDKPLSGLLLEKNHGTALSGDEVDAYEPLFGAARHYGWLTAVSFAAVTDGVATADGLDADIILLPGSSCAVLPVDGTVVGGGLDPSFWQGVAPEPTHLERRLLYGEIPAQAQPEDVLAMLRSLPGYSSQV